MKYFDLAISEAFSLGYNYADYIGGGCCGEVYKVSKHRAIKLTKDILEVSGVKKLIGRTNSYVVRYHSLNYTSNGLYIIEMDLGDKQDENFTIDDFILENYHKLEYLENNDISHLSFNDYLIMKDIIYGVRELKSIGITPHDIKIDNTIKLKDRTLLLDIQDISK